MTEVDRYFDPEIKAIATDSKAIAYLAAEELREDVQRQIKRNFNNPSAAFSRGIKVYEFEEAAYVRLSPILSSHAESKTIQGQPNLWILLPDGARLGFKRIGKGFNWDTLKRRYGRNLAFAPVGDGYVVLYRYNGTVRAIYKIQSQVQTTQRIEFYEKAEEIGERYGMHVTEDDREVGFR